MIPMFSLSGDFYEDIDKLENAMSESEFGEFLEEQRRKKDSYLSHLDQLYLINLETTPCFLLLHVAKSPPNMGRSNP